MSELLKDEKVKAKQKLMKLTIQLEQGRKEVQDAEIAGEIFLVSSSMKLELMQDIEHDIKSMYQGFAAQVENKLRQAKGRASAAMIGVMYWRWYRWNVWAHLEDNFSK